MCGNRHRAEDIVQATVTGLYRHWSPAPEPDPPEDRHALRVALAALPRPHRTVIVLRYICDLSVEDTAAALRYAPNTVKSHTVRRLAALRRILGDAARLR
ncbi:hypothetical protein GCM10009557_69070 [Virgisporangium ochraceum]